MAVPIMPIRIPGRWKQGYALDLHTRSSTYLGDDQYGRPMFDTKRSELGELLYQLKYNGDESTVDDLVDTAASFFRRWKPEIDVLLPVPPTRARFRQPVYLIAEALGHRIGIPVETTAVRRIREIPEIKNVYDFNERLQLLEGAYQVDVSHVQSKKILLFDDLFRSGATMNAITASLYDEGRVAEVYALALAQTRRKA